MKMRRDDEVDAVSLGRKSFEMHWNLHYEFDVIWIEYRTSL